MALIVEDGTGVADAESYAGVAAADAYWAARPHNALGVAWTANNDIDKQEGALREGSSFLDATWGPLYRGSRATAAQGLLWPRVTRVDLALTDWITTLAALEAAQAVNDILIIGADGLILDPLPKQIISTAIELAARALTTPLAPDQVPGSPGWLKRRKVGPIEREWGGPGTPGGSYGFVDTMLGPVLIGQRNGQWNWR